MILRSADAEENVLLTRNDVICSGSTKWFWELFSDNVVYLTDIKDAKYVTVNINFTFTADGKFTSLSYH